MSSASRQNREPPAYRVLRAEVFFGQGFTEDDGLPVLQGRRVAPGEGKGEEVEEAGVYEPERLAKDLVVHLHVARPVGDADGALYLGKVGFQRRPEQDGRRAPGLQRLASRNRVADEVDLVAQGVEVVLRGLQVDYQKHDEAGPDSQRQPDDVDERREPVF